MCEIINKQVDCYKTMQKILCKNKPKKKICKMSMSKKCKEKLPHKRNTGIVSFQEYSVHARQ